MSSTSSPVVSVVTPVHNTEAYLAECIESVLAQTFTDFEYIIVENASTDRSGEIADHYARLDDRIRVIRTERLLPQVENYNFALSQISPRSRYTKICQADDWLFPRCLEEMVAFGDAHESAAIISSYYLLEREIHNTGLEYWETAISGRTACRKFLIDGQFLFGSPTTVAYRSELVRRRRPFYEAGRLHEDTELCFEVLRDSDFGFVHQLLSFSRLQAGSITGESHTWEPAALDRLIILSRFGDDYLTEEEREAVWARDKRHYYAQISRAFLSQLRGGIDKEFWSYQRRGLSTVGQRLELGLLAWYVVRSALLLAGCPLDLVRARRGRFHGPRWSGSDRSPVQVESRP